MSGRLDVRTLGHSDARLDVRTTGRPNDCMGVRTAEHSLKYQGGSGNRGVWKSRFGINHGSISFGQLSGYIVFCILLIGGASPLV